jgi:predicted amidohydrolase
MKIALLQTDIVWNDPQANILRVERLMQQSEPADLYVLPEMWATGFAVEPEGIAEDEQTSLALAWMRQTARQKGCAISGSLAVRSLPPSGGRMEGGYRNRHYFVTPDTVTFYDKHHLFTYGHEDEHYTAGQEAVIVEWRDWRILLQTCYDLRFPCFSRYGRNTHSASTPSPLIYDAIIYVANWPEKRQLAWDTLIRARAIENQCYVIAVNRVGDDPACHYAGGSAVIDPTGRTVAECPSGEHPATAEICIEKLREMRSRFRVLDERD